MIKSNLLIIVNEDDEILDHKSKAECHRSEGLLHRAFSVFIFNDKGELLLQRRSQKKQLWPGVWSNTCCSHPGKGELIKAAAEKRLKTEMGFSCPLKFVGKLQYQADYESFAAENEITYVFIGRYDGQVKPNTKEVSEIKWLGLKKLKQELKDNLHQYSPWLKKIIKKFSIFNPSINSGLTLSLSKDNLQ